MARTRAGWWIGVVPAVTIAVAYGGTELLESGGGGLKASF